MLRKTLALLILLSASSSAWSTQISGILTGTLRAENGPYLVTKDILVPSDDSLTIEPGSIIMFSTNTRFTIEGHLISRGEIMNTIRFTASYPDTFAGSWSGIFFEGKTATGEIRNSMIQFAECGITCREASAININDNIIAYTSHAGIVCQLGAAPKITDNLVQYTRYGIIADGKSGPSLHNNIIQHTSIVGIYCIDHSSPKIDYNVITTSKGPGIWCLAGSAPRIENNIISNNANGICCTASSPFIAANAINRNHNNGILSHLAKPVVTANNIFDHPKKNLAVFGPDTVIARENWWGENSIAIAYTGNLEPSFVLDENMFIGPIDHTGYLMVPHEIGIEQPKAVVDVSLKNVSRAAQDTFCIGDRIRVELVGIDGSSTTRDHVGIIIQNPLAAQHTSKLYLEETTLSSGVYQGIFTIGSEHLFQDTKDGSNNLAIFSHINTSHKKLVRVLTAKPIIEQLAINDNTSLQRISSKRPFSISWAYRVPNEKMQPQTSFEVHVSRSENFTDKTIIDSIIGKGTSTSYLHQTLNLAPGTQYYVRVRARDNNAWSEWKTLAFRTNTPPAEPQPVFPLPGMELESGLWPTMVAKTAADADGDHLSYVFEVYRDKEMHTLFARGDASTVNKFQTWDLPHRLEENSSYWWRSCAIDDVDSSKWSGLHQFCMNMEDEPLQPFDLFSPGIDGNARIDDILFHWNASIDPDPGEHTITYTLWISTEPDFKHKTVVEHLTSTTYRPTFPLNYGTTYYWKVMASDGKEICWSNTASYPYQEFTTNHIQIAGN